MSFGHDNLAAIKSLDVKHAPASGGKIQHGVVTSPSNYTPLGDGSATDMTATAQSFIGNSGAYFDQNDATGDNDQALIAVATCATTAIGDAFAPRGDERTLLLPTERGYSMLFEHGAEDSPQPQPGERYMLHRAATTTGDYADAVFDAGIRYLNDGPTSGDGLGTTEIGYQGALTIIQTKGGWRIVEDDTAGLLTIYYPGGNNIAFIVDNGAGKVSLAGANGNDPTTAIVRLGDEQTYGDAIITAIQTWCMLHFSSGTNPTAPPIVKPDATASESAYTL